MFSLSSLIDVLLSNVIKSTDGVKLFIEHNLNASILSCMLVFLLNLFSVALLPFSIPNSTEIHPQSLISSSHELVGLLLLQK